MSSELILENNLLRITIDSSRASIDELHYKPTGCTLKLGAFSSLTDSIAPKQQDAPLFHRKALVNAVADCSFNV